MIPLGGEFICGVCQKPFRTVRTDAEAIAKSEKRWGMTVTEETHMVVCDDCYKQMTAQTGATCKTCQRVLNDPDEPISFDCGGDCVRCAAEKGDLDAAEAMRLIREHRAKWG